MEKVEKKNTEKTPRKQGYEVGNRKPPKEYRWKKGQSGNPAGKPVGTVSLTAMIKRKLLELTPDGRRSALEVLSDNIIQDSLDSSEKMRQLIWNYMDGLPKQSMEITGNLNIAKVLDDLENDGKNNKTNQEKTLQQREESKDKSNPQGAS